MIITVVGASGFVGKAIVAAAKRAGHEVAEVKAPRLATSKRKPLDIVSELSKAHIHDVKVMSDAFTSSDVVINAAGLASPGARASDALVGANALLPGLIVQAAILAGVRRVVHVSSAAVHGDARTLDAAATVLPISPYGWSKLWGEEVATLTAATMIDVVIYRPTSVHGAGRHVTEVLTRFAKSPFSSVSFPSNAPTPQVLVEDVGEYAVLLSTQTLVPSGPVIHPWAGWTVSSFLEHMGNGKKPVVIPRSCATFMLNFAKFLGKFHAGLKAQARRLEMLWFGQEQIAFDSDDEKAETALPAKPLTIGILTQWYDPEPGPASLPGALARGLVERGYRVKVLTGIPNYPLGQIYPGYRNRKSCSSHEKDIQVTRVPLYANHSSSAFKRALNYISFACSARLFGRGALKDVDVLWVYNSPPSIAYPLRQQKKITGAPVITHIMDLWPDSFLATSFSAGVLQRLALRYFESLTKKTYELSDRVAYISPGVRDVLSARGVDSKHLTYIPTWVEASVIEEETEVTDLDFEPTPGSRTLVYAGAIGAVQSLDLVVEAVSINRNLPIELLFIGTGTAKEDLVEKAKGVKNITFLDPIPPQQMKSVYEIADFMLISLGKSNLAKTTTPSKFSQILQQSIPIAGIGEGDIRNQILTSGSGVVAEPTLDSVTEMLNLIAEAPSTQVSNWGNSGRKFYEENLSYPVLMDRIDAEFKELINKKLGDG